MIRSYALEYDGHSREACPRENRERESARVSPNEDSSVVDRIALSQLISLIA